MSTNKYREFFVGTEEGMKLISSLKALRRQKHAQAEKSPELARDYTQRARGINEAVEHIESFWSDIKKPGRDKPE